MSERKKKKQTATRPKASDRYAREFDATYEQLRWIMEHGSGIQSYVIFTTIQDMMASLMLYQSAKYVEQNVYGEEDVK